MIIQQVLTAGRVRLSRYRPPAWRSHLHGSEFAWAVAFIAPYVGVLLAFAVYPIAYGFWMAGDPALYVTLFAVGHSAVPRAAGSAGGTLEGHWRSGRVGEGVLFGVLQAGQV